MPDLLHIYARHSFAAELLEGKAKHFDQELEIRGGAVDWEAMTLAEQGPESVNVVMEIGALGMTVTQYAAYKTCGVIWS